jgi:hypothetical protein
MLRVERPIAIKIAVSLGLFCASLLNSTVGSAQPSDRPPIWNLGDAVVTGFSGTVPPDPSKPLPANKSALDLTFINPDGPSARIVDLALPGFVWDGRVWNAPKKFDVLARDVGQVFGAAVDDEQVPNIYLTATSAFGLRIVVPARDGSGAPERVRTGQRGATWMKGQFGIDRGGGPGSIWKVDGRTGDVRLFANVMLDGAPNTAAGLGNVAYDAARKQLFVSDLGSGMIHRLDMSGKNLGRYDHGVTGRRAAKQREVSFNRSARIDITSSRFDSENPDTWGLAQPERRVWGLTVYRDRLYYSVWDGPQIWSIGIRPDGNFGGDPRWELDVENNPSALPVSDMIFSNNGAMILAQRGGFASSYDYSAFTRSLGARVLQYVLEVPDDPKTPSRWIAKPREYAVGFPADYRNTNGGVALGYGYGRDGRIDANSCESSIWITGENLRNDPGLRDRLEPGGPLVVHGIQGGDSNAVRDANAAPWASYFIDYDDKFEDPRASGHIGVVRVYTTPCAPAADVRPITAVVPIATPIGCVGPNCRNVCTPTCICPPGTVLQGKECVKRECPPPQVLDPVTGACKCPPGTVLIDGTCRRIQTMVPPHSCKPPLVPGLQPGSCVCPKPMVPGELPGTCKCPQGTVLVDGQCVPPPHECRPPLVFDPITRTCVCPQGTVMQDGKCVPQICPPPLVPGPCECPAGTVQDGGLCVPKTPIDLGVEKTGATTPVQEPFYVFDITVTNYGGAIPANTVTVTDTVPPNMTFNSIGGVGWTCLPPGGPAGTVITCTYAPSVTPGQVLPVIHVNATATGPAPYPPVTNCAVVGTAPGSGLVDSNPSNDKWCVTVVKPDRTGSLSVTKVVSPDPRGIGNTLIFPMTVICTNPNATYTLNVHGNTSTVPTNLPIGSICTVTETQPTLPAGCTWLPPVYSPASVTIASGLNHETVTNNYRCREICPPPQVMIPGVGCRCPDGEVLVGKECVKKIVCDRPLVPNAAGTECVCRDGLVLRRGKCVERERPKPSKTCKRGFVWNGDMCVKRKTEPKEERARERPGIQIPLGFPGLGGGGGGGGGGAGRR